MTKIKYKTICISDLHLGTKDYKAELLNNFLSCHECDNLFLVGDIIDGWKIIQNKWKWKKSHTTTIRKILGYSKAGTNVVYITGNHDEFIRPFINKVLNLGSIKIVNQYSYIDLSGKRLLVTHGDMFDGISELAPWLGLLGDKLYDFVLWLNNGFNFLRRKMGFGYRSMSKFLKDKVKDAVSFIFKFETNLTTYAKKHDYEGVICGHIHTPDIKVIDDIIYMNDGDWVESCSALVETMDGEWKIIYWNSNE